MWSKKIITFENIRQLVQWNISDLFTKKCNTELDIFTQYSVVNTVLSFWAWQALTLERSCLYIV